MWMFNLGCQTCRNHSGRWNIDSGMWQSSPNSTDLFPLPVPLEPRLPSPILHSPWKAVPRRASSHPGTLWIRSVPQGSRGPCGLVSIWDVASATEKLHFEFHSILLNLNLILVPTCGLWLPAGNTGLSQTSGCSHMIDATSAVCVINSQLILRSQFTQAQENPISYDSTSDGPGLPLLHPGSTLSDISYIICHLVLLWSFNYLLHFRARKFFLLCIPNLLAIWKKC